VIESFGAIDVWVNNAAVTGFGRIDEMPEELYQQIIETNLMGYVNGTRAAVSRFRKQGAGVLINVASVAGKIGQPYTSAYCTSKFGIVGLSNSVRAELLDEPNIHVCTVLPPSIDTPLFQHGANYAGRQAKPMPPVYSADRVARAILSLAVRPKREVAIGAMGKFLNTFSRVTPAMAERILARQVSKKHFSDQPASEELGNVIEPTADPYGVSGGWTKQQESRSYGSKALLGVGVALVAAFGAYMLAQKSRPEVEEEPRAEGEEYELLSPEQVPEGAYAPL
jgi:short-subunit dehydrogenase